MKGKNNTFEEFDYIKLATVTWIFEDNSLESLLVKLKCLSHLIVLGKTENSLGLLLTMEIHVYWVDQSQKHKASPCCP